VVDQSSPVTDVQQAVPVAGEDRPISEHPCHGLFSETGDNLTHRHWFQANELMPTCERCGTPIGRDHKETGPVSWEPEKRREVVTLDHRYALSNAAMNALAEWLAWPDAGRDGPREVTVDQTLSFLRGLPNQLGYGKHLAEPASGLAGRREVNTILSRLMQQLQPDCPDMGERIRLGNEACTAILALTPTDSAHTPAIDRLTEPARKADRLGEGVPEGWKLVPVEATDEMVDAAIHYRPMDVTSRVRIAWRDMIAASPTLPDPTHTREAVRNEIINTPETADFMAGVPIEALHQRERWGVNHDSGKTPEDWFWLVGYLAQKALRAQNAGDIDKALHHTISTGAALANWHAAITGADTSMRPGIADPDDALSAGSAQ
jgi:hypothetical protein